PQDIFKPLYNHQLPPGAGQVVQYKLELPADLKAPVELEVKLRYRNFDFEYLSLVYEGGDKVPKLPVIDICSDRVTLPVEGADDPPAPWWSLAWFNGQVNFENVRDRKGFDAAVADFEKILDPANQPRDRKFDFTLDYVVRNRLAQALFKRAQLEGGDPARREPFLLRAVEQYERTLQLDPEDVDAHYGLKECYSLLGRSRPLPKAEGPAPATDEKTLRELAFTLTSGSAPQQMRLAAAARLIQAVGALDKEPPSAAAPKRP